MYSETVSITKKYEKSDSIDLEKTMYFMMLSKKRYAFNLTCYPEKNSEIHKQFNEINKSSISQKFLLEYVSAQPPKGTKILGEMDYEELLSICSAIIDWANTSDLFEYKIINSEMSILNSGRIGIDKTNIDRLETLRNNSSISQTERNSNPYIDTYNTNAISSRTPDDLNNAFIDEFGYSFSDYVNCILALIELGNEIESDVKVKNQEDIYQELSIYVDIKESIVQKIISDISLFERKEYLKPPSRFSKNDIFPWKFNRRLSVTRRPIVKFEGKLIWGNRQLYHCLLYTIDLINNGKFPVFNNNGKLKSLLGKVANYEGNHFNDVVATKLKSISGLIIDSKVKKINGIKIMDDAKQDMGKAFR